MKSKTLAILCMFMAMGGGCGYSTKIAPQTSSSSTTHQILASPSNTNDYMIKYLPANVEVAKSDLKFTYEFSSTNQESSNTFDGLNLFNPLILVGFPMSNDNYAMAGNLRFFDGKNELKFSSVCATSAPRNIFQNTNMTNLRNECISKIRENLQNQIDENFEKGGFDVFKR